MSDLPRSPFIAAPLLPLTVGLCTGIAIQHYASIAWTKSFVALAAVAVSTVAITLLKKWWRASTAALIAALLCTGVVLGMTGGGHSQNRLGTLYDHGVIASGDPVEVTGILSGEPEPAPQSLYLTMKVERVKFRALETSVNGTIQLLTNISTPQIQNEYDNLELRHGARIRVMAALTREDDFRNPGVMPFTEYLEREGYDATGVIKSPLLVERLDDTRVFLPQAWLYEWRDRLQKEFARRFSAETAGVLNAALLGNPHNISGPAAERFRAGGTFHILVISGLQIAFIAGAAILIVRRVSRRKWIQFLLATAFLWAYTIAVGAQASVARAALMFTVATFAPIVARRANSLNTVAGAALVLLVITPSELFDPSFQLTFGSVLAIVCLAVPLLRQMQRVGSWQPTMVTPHPPNCPAWFRKLSEALFWSERAWRVEQAASNVKYRLFKIPVAARLERWRVQPALRFIAGALVVSASVQLGLLPLMILYFHRISIASLLLNIFVGFLMAVLSFAALIAILIAQLSATLAAPIIALAEKTNWLIIHAVGPFSRLGVASMRLPHYSGWRAAVYVFYFALLISLVWQFKNWHPLRSLFSSSDAASQRRQRLASATAALFSATSLIVIFHPLSAARPDGRFHIDFLDVGQGDSALLTMPDGTTMLIDGGGRPNIDWTNVSDEGEQPFQRDRRSIGERVVSEYLWSRGLDRIDYLIATHADADHIDGLNDIVRNFKVRGAIVARVPMKDEGFARFAQSLKTASVPIEVIGRGDSLRLGDVIIDAMWPPPLADADAPYRNNDGLVLRARYGARSFLFAADVEKESEIALLTSAANLRSDFVKVAHHGSRTSSIQPFVDATRPAVAVISVGRTSIFGHPHKEVVERWLASGARVMTTGEKGTISVVTDGRELKLSTFVP